MSLYIAEDPIRVVIRLRQAAIYDTEGRMISKAKRGVNAQFKRGIAEPWALQVAKDTFEFRKKPPEVPVENWAAYYDPIEDQHANSWDDDELAAVIEKLDQHHACIKIERPVPTAPYVLYDKHRSTKGKRTVAHAIKDITAAFELAGFDVGHAILYEQATLNDKTVLDALAGLGAVEEPTVVEEELIEA